MRSDERAIPLQEKLDKETTCLYKAGLTIRQGCLGIKVNAGQEESRGIGLLPVLVN